MKELGANIRVHGVARSKDTSTGVAVVVDEGWNITKVNRHGSGRAIGVEVERGGVQLEIISVYMPSGLKAKHCSYNGTWNEDDKVEDEDEDEEKAEGPDAQQRQAGSTARSGVLACERAREAEDIYNWVKERMRESRHRVIVAGDLNEPRSLAGRRRIGPSGVVPRKPGKPAEDAA